MQKKGADLDASLAAAQWHVSYASMHNLNSNFIHLPTDFSHRVNESVHNFGSKLKETL